MKNIIFSLIKSVQENCVTFSCRLCADLSSFFWTNTFIKKLFYYGTLLLLGFGFTPNSYGQLVGEGAIKANFGVEADAYANFIGFSIVDPLYVPPPPPDIQSGTDDWFEKLSGN
ncbi:MAG TPA: hypothetical protein VFS71_09765, partial [Flavobacterium sp.]|uniref:hypothetical protein n=1 Tax=Flavobacterium sp. TaxID=239 RepID=UPI002DBBB486